MLVFMRLLHPLVWVFCRLTTIAHRLTTSEADPQVTESEIISLAGHGEVEGTIETEEREMIERVFAFNDLEVKDVMTPRHLMFALASNRTVAEVVPEVIEGNYSRIPLFTANRDEVGQVIYLRDLLRATSDGKADTPLNAIAHEPLFVPENQSLNDFFGTLRRHRQQLAVVVDEHGVVRGIATMEDLLEELVGEIYDETDEAPTEVTQVAEGRVAVSGATEVRLVEEHFGLDLAGKPTDTISLWILRHTQRIPRVGEELQVDGLKVVVDKATGRRIQQVILEPLPAASAEHDPATASFS
jgi:CBS domain containing-hemolysin-like protein